MENLFEDFTVAILRINKLVQRIKLYEMEEYGLKAIHVMCVYYLAHNPKGLTAGELIALTLEDKAAISRAIKILREKEYVVYDSRKYNSAITLTPSGEQVARHIEERAKEAVIAGKDDALGETNRKIFYDALNVIANNLHNYYAALQQKRQTEEEEENA